MDSCRTIDGEIPESSACGSLDFDVGALEEIEDRLQCVLIDRTDIWTKLFSDSFSLPNHGPARKYRPLSVISAKVRLALRCRSILCEYTRVLRACNGSPVKKSVSCLYAMVSRGASRAWNSKVDQHSRESSTNRRRLPARCRPRRYHSLLCSGLRDIVVSKEQDQQQRQHHDDGHRAHTRTTVKGVCAEIPEGGHSQTQPVSVCLPLCTSTDIQRKEEGGQIRCYSMPKQKEEADNGRGRGRGRDRGRIAGENDVVYIAKGAAAVSSVRCEAMRSASLLAGGFGIIELDVPSDGALLYFTVLHRARLPYLARFLLAPVYALEIELGLIGNRVFSSALAAFSLLYTTY